MVKASRAMIGDTELTAASHQVMLAILHLQDEDGKTKASNKEFAELTNRNRSTIGRALLQLEERGYIAFETERQIGYWTPSRTIWIMREEAM